MGGLPISGHRNILFFRCSVIDILYFDEDEYPGVSQLFLELLLKPFDITILWSSVVNRELRFHGFVCLLPACFAKMQEILLLWFLYNLLVSCAEALNSATCNMESLVSYFIVHNVSAYFWSQMIREVVSCKFRWKLLRHSETSEATGLYFSGIELHKVQILLKLAFG